MTTRTGTRARPETRFRVSGFGFRMLYLEFGTWNSRLETRNSKLNFITPPGVRYLPAGPGPAAHPQTPPPGREPYSLWEGPGGRWEERPPCRSAQSRALE